MTAAATPPPERVFGIYGFSFTRQCDLGNIRLVPLFAPPEAKERAEDRETLRLTGYGVLTGRGEGERALWSRMHLIAAGMTFAQQRHVVTTRVIEMSPGDTIDALFSPQRLGQSIPAATDRQSFGSAILSDDAAPNSTGLFLTEFVRRFEAEVGDDSLRLAFFRQIEISRLATPFIELHHFLAFSGLELLARATGPHSQDRNAAIPIAYLLNQHGFAVSQSEIEAWCRARNEAFHRGRLSAPDPNGGPDTHLGDQLFPLTQVLCDVLLKLLPFDDGHINWNRWRDRMPFA